MSAFVYYLTCGSSIHETFKNNLCYLLDKISYLNTPDTYCSDTTSHSLSNIRQCKYIKLLNSNRNSPRPVRDLDSHIDKGVKYINCTSVVFLPSCSPAVGL